MTAEVQSLHRRERAGAVYGGQGVVFVHSSLHDSATVESAVRGSLEHVDASASNHIPPGQGYKIDSTPQGGFLDTIEDR